jgi:hypothetical protein
MDGPDELCHGLMTWRLFPTNKTSSKRKVRTINVGHVNHLVIDPILNHRPNSAWENVANRTQHDEFKWEKSTSRWSM